MRLKMAAFATKNGAFATKIRPHIATENKVFEPGINERLKKDASAKHSCMRLKAAAYATKTFACAQVLHILLNSAAYAAKNGRICDMKLRHIHRLSANFPMCGYREREKGGRERGQEGTEGKKGRKEEREGREREKEGRDSGSKGQRKRREERINNTKNTKH